MTIEEIDDKIKEHEIKFNLILNSFNLETIHANDNIRNLQKLNYEIQYLKTLKDKSLWETKKEKL